MPGELQHTLSDSELQTVQDLKAAGGVAGLGGGPLAYVNYNGTPATILASYNITGVNKVGTGIYDITISAAEIPDVRRMFHMVCETPVRNWSAETFGGGVYRVRTTDLSGTPADAVFRWALWDVAGAS